MEYYYTEKKNISEDKSSLIIESFEFKHLTKVLRKREGDVINITDGEGYVYESEIIAIEKDKITCRILKTDFDIFEPKAKVHLYICSLKSSERLEFAIEKAVEIGVKSITPVFSERVINKSDYSPNKIKRLNQIILSAMSQSQRCFKPVLHKVETFSEMLSKTKSFGCKLAMYEFADSNNKIQVFDEHGEMLLLTGPEGGFSDKEINELKNSNWKVLSLGERKLRAETAVIAALSKILI
ncbi:MAG: 16S rRNA (uracil(1498)-N(3))-methyltransferase [Ignavibacteria bacterium]|nr:16S rRNA (uracil(1498)-N(3))-methyltransferase [Ignavibacteria bacterium]